VRVKEILEDPGISTDNTIVKSLTGVGSATTGASSFLAGALAASTPPGALAFLATSLLSGGATAYAGNNINNPQDVYFTITGDDSR
jgi:hypothetical protein